MKRKKVFAILLIFTIIAVISGYYSTVVLPCLRAATRLEVASAMRNAINQANEVISAKSSGYDSFFSVNYSNDNEIVSVTPNVGLINQISMLWGTEIENRIGRQKELKINRPAGYFSGSPLLVSFGKEVTYTCVYKATSRTEYKSVFTHCGVNQTLHRLFLVVYAEAEIVSPVKTEKVEINDQLLYAENVLNGKVPGTYIASTEYTDYLDLLE